MKGKHTRRTQLAVIQGLEGWIDNLDMNADHHAHQAVNKYGHSALLRKTEQRIASEYRTEAKAVRAVLEMVQREWCRPTSAKPKGGG